MNSCLQCDHTSFHVDYCIENTAWDLQRYLQKSTLNKVLNHYNCILVQYTPFGIWFIDLKKLNGSTLGSKKKAQIALARLLILAEFIVMYSCQALETWKIARYLVLIHFYYFQFDTGVWSWSFQENNNFDLRVIDWRLSSLQNSAKVQKVLLRPSYVREIFALSSVYSCIANACH